MARYRCMDALVNTCILKSLSNLYATKNDQYEVFPSLNISQLTIVIHISLNPLNMTLDKLKAFDSAFFIKDLKQAVFKLWRHQKTLDLHLNATRRTLTTK